LTPSWRGASGAIALALSAAACTRALPRPAPVAQGDPAAEAAAAREVVARFVAAEARLDESADTLLAPGADFVATGIVVARRPRLSGMMERGVGEVVETRVEVAGGFAWVAAVYSWAPNPTASVERARATFVLEKRPAGWRIRHVHSSWVEPW
jgi:hypothetical protein